MAGKKGLGKGIGALIPTSEEDESTLEIKKTDTNEAQLKENDGEVYVKTALLEPNKAQPRKVFDMDALKELSESISRVGILQPIVVRKKDDKYYEIIAGERRWRAAKLAKLKEVPVCIRDFTSAQVMEAALIENIQREDLNPIEEALAYEQLISEYGLKQEEVAERVSKSRAQISNIMRLLKLPDEIRTLIISGSLSAGHARALLAIDDKEIQIEAADTVIKEDLSVRETEKLVKELSHGKDEAGQKVKEINPAGLLVYKEMEKKLGTALGSKVKIKSKNGEKGRIEIEYYSNEELERLFDKLRR